MKTLSDFTDAELNAMPYENVKALRRQAAIAHVTGMPQDPRITAWVPRMTRKHKTDVVGMHFHGRHHLNRTSDNKPVFEPDTALPWLAALLIGRYGEAPYHWPTEWSEDDIKRALEWEQQDRGFEGAFLLPKEV